MTECSHCSGNATETQDAEFYIKCCLEFGQIIILRTSSVGSWWIQLGVIGASSYYPWWKDALLVTFMRRLWPDFPVLLWSFLCNLRDISPLDYFRCSCGVCTPSHSSICWRTWIAVFANLKQGAVCWIEPNCTAMSGTFWTTGLMLEYTIYC